MGEKPAFDPSKPFDIVETGEKPEFDPSKPFEEVKNGETDDDTLKQIGRYVLDMFGGPAKELLGTLAAPIVEANKFTSAPPRAAVGALQRGEGLSGAGEAFVDQAIAAVPSANGPGQVLPTTPTGEEIADKGMASVGIPAPFREKTAPMAGMVTELGLDLTNIVPGTPATTAVGALDKYGLKGIAAAENAVGKGVMGAGRVATFGALDYNKARQAARNLKATELLFPGNESFGPMAHAIREVGAARAALKEGAVTVPGSHEVVLAAADELMKAKSRSRLHTHADGMIDDMMERAFRVEDRVVPQIIPPEQIEARIAQTEAEIANFESQYLAAADSMHGHLPPQEQADALWRMRDQVASAKSQLEQVKARYLSGEPFTVNVTKQVRVPRDLTLDELDDLTGMMDEMVYNGSGSPKALRRIWGPALKKNRAALDEVMQTVPEGKLFKEKKTHLADLKTASKGRSKLFSTAALGIGGYAQTERLMDGDLSISPAALVALSLQPQAYFRLMGALKMPGGMARTLGGAYKTGKLGAMREAIAKAAEAEPFWAERFIRGAALVSGKPAAQQFLTEDEVNTLGLHREFDPELVAAERARIQKDRDMTSSEKARRLTDINRNGYFVVEIPQAEPDAMGTEQRVFGGRAGLDNLMEDLKRSGGGGGAH